MGEQKKTVNECNGDEELKMTEVDCFYGRWTLEERKKDGVRDEREWENL